MIFEGLEANPTTLRKLRLVCQLFEDLVVPILYHHVTLTSRLLNEYVPPSHFSSENYRTFNPRELVDGRQRKWWERFPPLVTFKPLHFQMGIYTKHITIDRKLFWPSVWKLLKDLDSLELIT